MPVDQIFFNCVSLSLTYFLIASGLTIVFSILGIINFAHGAFCMLGGMFTYFSFVYLGINFYLSLVLSMVVMAGFSILIYNLVFKHFTKMPIVGCIAAIGLTMVIQQSTLIALGGEEKFLLNALPKGVVIILGTSIALDRLTVVIASLIIMAGVFFLLHRTDTGMMIRAVAQEPVASSLCGVNPERIAYICMALGGALAAAAGGLIGALFTVSPYWGETIILKAFIVVILGGLGSVPGAVVGSLILGFIEGIGLTMVGYFTVVITFVLIVVILLVRPKGILGHD